MKTSFSPHNFVFAVSGQRVADSKHCKKPDGLFPHDQYCDYYYDCQDGEAVLQACPNGLAFAGKKKASYFDT